MKHQIAILDAIGNKAAVLRSTLEKRLGDLGVDPLRDAEFLDKNNLHKLNTECRRVAVLFSDGSAGRGYAMEVQQVLDSPAVVIPAVDSLDNFSSKVPAALQATNGMELDPADTQLEQVAGLALEILGLLRKKRRIFISYKRSEAAAAAHQLYQDLDERAFDVFLDTLSVRAADQFQEQLWHRMTDSDIVVLLYTKTIHSSGWVEREIERASGMKITVLQLVWPGVLRDPKTELFEPVYLTDEDFDPTEPIRISQSKILSVCTLVESLRASSLSRREQNIMGTLRERADKAKLKTKVQAAQYVDVYCDEERFTRVIPGVGVPDSEVLYACVNAHASGSRPKEVVVLYDSLNVTANWNLHLDWLRDYLPVKTVKLFEVDTWLSSLCP